MKVKKNTPSQILLQRKQYSSVCAHSSAFEHGSSYLFIQTKAIGHLDSEELDHKKKETGESVKKLSFFCHKKPLAE